ncbi:scarecrow-like protein 3 isoform X2 [Andrographis paniculata]|uniref:scarecrow-like protein 3 isoform X2 n=1 Tax=Andrographis paniculata TaxID=175694 RepID=UPI0021E8683C|nr:scarecrow-like protein 3 isoform X2 [Andrographis paniculata]
MARVRDGGWSWWEVQRAVAVVGNFRCRSDGEGGQFLSGMKLDVTLSLSLSQPRTAHDALKPQERSVKLIQLLLNCARHASSGNLQHADDCLLQISQLASITGDSMQRLAARFASALAVRLVKRWPGLYKALNSSATISCNLDHARSIFVRKFPCLKFAYAVISRTLIQAMSGEHAIHIIDFGSGDPNLWVPFIKGLGDRKPEPPHLTITCVGRSNQEISRAKLAKEAETLNIPFQFKCVNVSLQELSLDMLEVQEGEAVALTSILSLHALLADENCIDAQFAVSQHDGKVKECREMNRFLNMVKSMKPKAMLLVEQEANHNSRRLLDRVVEGLHYYSAIFDFIDTACGGFLCSDRTALEGMFGKEIENVVAGEERHERHGQWGIRLARAGLRPIRLWYQTMEEARRVVEGYRPAGFKVVGDEKGSLMICWRDRPIYAVSAWGCFQPLRNAADV